MYHTFWFLWMSHIYIYIYIFLLHSWILHFSKPRYHLFSVIVNILIKTIFFGGEVGYLLDYSTCVESFSPQTLATDGTVHAFISKLDILEMNWHSSVIDIDWANKP